MFANLAGTGAQPFCRYVSSASRADITGDGKVSSLAPDPSTPQVPPARERVACKKERKSANKRISENKENLENRNAHDDMRTWLHSALSSPARHRGLSHVQQNYTDVPQRGNNMVPGSHMRTYCKGKRSFQSFFTMRGSVVPKSDDRVRSQSIMQYPDDFTGNIHVNDQSVAALALSDEKRPEHVDPRPLHCSCRVHVALLVVIGNSWLWDKHWYENK